MTDGPVSRVYCIVADTYGALISLLAQLDLHVYLSSQSPFSHLQPIPCSVQSG